ncbi:50S ribosomal protein L7/L12 [bacterium]|nr:50S ribosomal protein L7/L12 [bacterium]
MEEKNQNEEKKEKEVPEKFKELIEKIENMSVKDLAEFVKVLEERFEVSAMPQMVAAAPAGAAGGGEAAEGKDSFSVILTSAGDQKIQVIKVVKEITGLGLKEAKDLVDNVPKPIKEGVKKEEAEEIKKKIEEVGGVVEIK